MSTVGRSQLGPSLSFVKTLLASMYYFYYYQGIQTKPKAHGARDLARAERSLSRTLQDCRSRGCGAYSPLPDFGRSVDPILTRRKDYAHHITFCPLDFQTFLRSCSTLHTPPNGKACAQKKFEEKAFTQRRPLAVRIGTRHL